MDPLLQQVESLVPHIATRVNNPYDGDRVSVQVESLLRPMVDARHAEDDTQQGK